MTIHIHRVPTRIAGIRPHGEVRWCFVCRKRVSFTRTVRTPVDPMSYYGPHAVIECDRGHVDGDYFPGTYREGEDVA